MKKAIINTETLKTYNENGGDEFVTFFTDGNGDVWWSLFEMGDGLRGPSCVAGSEVCGFAVSDGVSEIPVQPVRGWADMTRIAAILGWVLPEHPRASWENLLYIPTQTPDAVRHLVVSYVEGWNRLRFHYEKGRTSRSPIEAIASIGLARAGDELGRRHAERRGA